MTAAIWTCEKLVAEAGDNPGTQRKGNICHWKLMPENW
jgi:hypothetical protein